MKFSNTLLLFAASTVYLTNVSAQMPTTDVEQVDLATIAPTAPVLIDGPIPASNASSTNEEMPFETTFPVDSDMDSIPAPTSFDNEETIPFPSVAPSTPTNNSPVSAVNLSTPEPMDTTPVPPGPRMPVNVPPSDAPIVIGEGTVPPFPSRSPVVNPVGPRPSQPIATVIPREDVQESPMPMPMNASPNMDNIPAITTEPTDMMDNNGPMITTPGGMDMMPTMTTDGPEDGEDDTPITPTVVPVPLPAVTLPNAGNTDATEEPDFSQLVAPTVTPVVGVPVPSPAAVFPTDPATEEPTEPTEIPRVFIPEATITPTPEVEPSATPIDIPEPVSTVLAEPDLEATVTPISDTESLVVADDTTPLPVESEESEDDDELDDQDSDAAVSFPPITGAEATAEETDEPACFPADATVQTENGEIVKMADLDVGARVLTANGVYSDVFMFTHRLKETVSNFVALETNKGQTLRLSPGHRIKIDDIIVAARDAKVGGVVSLADGTIANIVEKNLVKDSGLYNPQTLNGDIVVNGVVATTYTEALPMTCAHSMLSVFRMMYNWFNASLHVMDGGVYGAKVAQNVLSSLA